MNDRLLLQCRRLFLRGLESCLEIGRLEDRLELSRELAIGIGAVGMTGHEHIVIVQRAASISMLAVS